MDPRQEALDFLALAEQNNHGIPVSAAQAQIAIGYALLAVAEALEAKNVEKP